MTELPRGLYAGTLVFQLVFFGLYEQTKYREGFSLKVSSVFKCLVTFSSLLLACLFALKKPGEGGWLICLALAVDTVADYVLNFRFVRGMALFGIGHGLYCLYFVRRNSVGDVNILVTLLLLCLGLAILWFGRDRLRKYYSRRNAAPFVAYAFVSCLLIGASCTLHPCMAVGAILFVVSDIMLGIRFALRVGCRAYEYICLLVYYIAQLLLATGLYFV